MAGAGPCGGLTLTPPPNPPPPLHAYTNNQGIVPIINENDAVSANQGYTEATVFSDNDSLAGA